MSQYPPLLFFLQLGVLISLSLAGYCAYRLRRYGHSLVVLCVGLLAVFTAIYNGAAAMKTASLTLPEKLWWYKLEFLGSAALPSVAAVLVLAYLGQERWLTRPVLGILVGIPAVGVPLIIVNPGAVMIIEPILVETGGYQVLEHGFPPLFVLFAAWGQGIFLLAVLLVGIKSLFGTPRRTQALILGTALGLPPAANLLKTLKVYPPSGDGFNLTPVFATGMLVLMALAIDRYQLFGLLPVGRSRAFDVMSDGYVLVDANGTIVDANRAARTLLGEERLSSRAARAVIPELSGADGAGDPAETDDQEKAADQGRPSDQARAGEPITFSVEERVLQARSSPIQEGAAAIGRVFMLRDITPLREREQALTEQAERLRELDEAKSRFFANVSHEFRTPLTLIQGPVRHVHASLEDAGGRPEDVKHLEIVDRNVARLQRLVDQLLGLARLEAGTYGLAARRVDPASEIRRIAPAFEPHADRQDLTLALSAEANRPDGADPLYVDPEALRHMMNNLLSNAIKFTPEGGRVDVTVQERDDAVVIAVRDTGPGIPESELDVIFDRFDQAGGQNTTRQDGTGIGLAFAQELVDLHGGTIEVDSSEGEGSTFTIRLPRGRDHLSEEKLADDPSRTAPEERDPGLEVPVLPSGPDDSEPDDSEPDEFGPNGPDEAPSQKGPPQRSRSPDGRDETAKRVLVVDDNADVRRYVRSVLAPSFEVLEAADGEEGTAMAREHLPDVILADVMMPGLNGHEMTRRLREDRKTEAIPVIMLTARASTEGEIAGLKAGADDYVTKPFDAAVLRQRVEGVVALQQRLGRRVRAEMEADASTAESPSVETTGRPDVEQEARAAVREHLSDPGFGAGDLASTISTSRSTLYRRLQEKAGVSPSALIADVRMKQARRLLERGEPVTQVAYAVGYERLSSFSRAFERHVGQSPSTVAAE